MPPSGRVSMVRHLQADLQHRHVVSTGFGVAEAVQKHGRPAAPALQAPSLAVLPPCAACRSWQGSSQTDLLQLRQTIIGVAGACSDQIGCTAALLCQIGRCTMQRPAICHMAWAWHSLSPSMVILGRRAYSGGTLYMLPSSRLVSVSLPLPQLSQICYSGSP